MTYISLERHCDICTAAMSIKVRAADYESWVIGELHIQEAFPDFSASEREMLLSNICGTCFDVFIADPEVEW